MGVNDSRSDKVYSRTVIMWCDVLDDGDDIILSEVIVEIFGRVEGLNWEGYVSVHSTPYRGNW